MKHKKDPYVGFEKIADNVAGYIGKKMPTNYSSYAHAARKTDPTLTREKIYKSMQRSIRMCRVVEKTSNFFFDSVRATLPF